MFFTRGRVVDEGAKARITFQHPASFWASRRHSSCSLSPSSSAVGKVLEGAPVLLGSLSSNQQAYSISSSCAIYYYHISSIHS
ncbi:hypothetical protein CEXT_450331 [Caerostris extrusa]|uniref:Uncharacterized protein n=1 Tax=Caerostris extrusa TaxID=172846 RepID=A0AAV4P2A2_CAEEX|nr:hypothetical protein CEXT_450331 [Caerostris extrusa]